MAVFIIIQIPRVFGRRRGRRLRELVAGGSHLLRRGWAYFAGGARRRRGALLDVGHLFGAVRLAAAQSRPRREAV